MQTITEIKIKVGMKDAQRKTAISKSRCSLKNEVKMLILNLTRASVERSLPVVNY